MGLPLVTVPQIADRQIQFQTGHLSLEWKRRMSQGLSFRAISMCATTAGQSYLHRRMMMFSVDYLLSDRDEPSRYMLTDLPRAKEFVRFLVGNYRPRFVLLTDGTGRQLSEWREG